MPDAAQLIAALRGGQDPMPFGVGGPAEPAIETGAPALVGAVAKGAGKLTKDLVDAASEAPMPGLRREDYTDVPGTAQPSDPLTHSAFNMANALAGVGAPAAEAGAAGIFGGKLAKTADLGRLEQAKRMAGSGWDLNATRQITGWHQGPDGEWRFEIPDLYSRMIHPDAHGPAGALLQHKELYKAYPPLKDINMYSETNPNFPSNSGMWDLGTGVMQMSSRNAEQARLGALHEMQHAVQHIEGFTPGTTVGAYRALFKDHPEVVAKEAPGLTPFDLYSRTAGEVEARNVENRANFGLVDRHQSAPWETQEYPYHLQLRVPAIEGDLPLLKALRGQ